MRGLNFQINSLGMLDYIEICMFKNDGVEKRFYEILIHDVCFKALLTPNNTDFSDTDFFC